MNDDNEKMVDENGCSWSSRVNCQVNKNENNNNVKVITKFDDG